MGYSYGTLTDSYLNVGIFSLGVGLSRAIDVIEKNVFITTFPTKKKIMLS